MFKVLITNDFLDSVTMNLFGLVTMSLNKKKELDVVYSYRGYAWNKQDTNKKQHPLKVTTYKYLCTNINEGQQQISKFNYFTLFNWIDWFDWYFHISQKTQTPNLMWIQSSLSISRIHD